MLNWAYAEDQPLVDYWICVVDFEQKVMDGIISPEYIRDTFDCTYPEGNFIGLNKRAVRMIKDPVVKRSEMAMKIYPNPSRDHLRLMVNWPESTLLQAELLNTGGRTTATLLNGEKVNKSQNEYTISTSSLTPGMYFLKVTVNETVRYFKVVVD